MWPNFALNVAYFSTLRPAELFLFKICKNTFSIQMWPLDGFEFETPGLEWSKILFILNLMLCTINICFQIKLHEFVLQLATTFFVCSQICAKTLRIQILPERSELITCVCEGPDPGPVCRVHVMHEDDDQAQHVDGQHAAHVDGGSCWRTGVDCLKLC